MGVQLFLFNLDLDSILSFGSMLSSCYSDISIFLHNGFLSSSMFVHGKFFESHGLGVMIVVSQGGVGGDIQQS